MNQLLKKLQFKNEEKILVLNPPPEFEDKLNDFSNYAKVVTKNVNSTFDFALVFIKSCAEIEKYSSVINKLNNNANLWFAYPKKSSKKYKTDISRDSGWQPIGDLGFEGVRLIAIDEDWSALRFRKAEDIKTMKRNSKLAMSTEGKKRTKK